MVQFHSGGGQRNKILQLLRQFFLIVVPQLQGDLHRLIGEYGHRALGHSQTELRRHVDLNVKGIRAMAQSVGHSNNGIARLLNRDRQRLGVAVVPGRQGCRGDEFILTHDDPVAARIYAFQGELFRVYRSLIRLIISK